MSLPSGTRIGPYETTGVVGAGGMGEVYRARDTRLGRDVAIKIIPAEYASDPERLGRFEQEARAVAAVSHPNILVVHDVGTRDGAPYLVTELLSGETLRELVSRGALPARTAIDYAIQVARGLAAAHEKGIVHRDLKPENVFVTTDGHVKILDFGLAKLTQVQVPELGISALPTTPPVGGLKTTPGMVLGTVGYMAPEQVRGVVADHRADIFALGAILYEMVTGRRAFRGESAIETMSTILRDQPPDLADSDRPVAPALRRCIEHCLEKRPESRFQSAQDVAFALEAIAGGSESSAREAAAVRVSSKRSYALAWKVGTGVAVLIALALAPSAVVHWREQPGEARVARFSIAGPPNLSLLAGIDIPRPRLSPDGRYVTFRAAETGRPAQIWIRSLDGLAMRPMAGTEQVTGHFWSPDSRFVGFLAARQLRVAEIEGGTVRTIADLPQELGGNTMGVWGPDDTILLGGAGSIGGSIWRVSPQGGEFSRVTRPDPQGSHLHPSFLPNGRRFLFSKVGTESPGLYLASLDTDEVSRLLPDVSRTEIVRGHILFVRGRTLMAQPFDSDRGQLSSEPIALVDDVASGVNGFAAFSVSDTGVLVVSGSLRSDSQFTWYTRSGQSEGVVGAPGNHQTMALSPDGRKLVFGRRAPGAVGQNLWVTDLVRSVTTRLTFGDNLDSDGTWSPDMTRIIFNSNRTDKRLFQVPASGGVEEELFKTEGRPLSSDDWSPDGRFLLFHNDGGPELWALPLTGDRNPLLVVKSSARVDEPSFSPDGRLIAYNSQESGREEVYLAPFPTTGARWQVSSNGGVQPTWRRDGRELYFLAPDGTMMAVTLAPGDSPVLSTPRPLFRTRLVSVGGTDQYAVSPDGSRFLIMNPVGDEAETPPTVILNWPALLEKR